MSTLNAEPIAVLGAGSWGTALSLALARNGQAVKLWDIDSALIQGMQSTRDNARYLPGIPLPENITPCETLEGTLSECHDILIAVPSHGFRALLENIKSQFTDKTRIVWATKGLDPDSGDILQKVFANVCGTAYPTAVLSGPSFAKEVAVNMPTAVTIASDNESWLKALTQHFHQDTFHVYTSHDVVAVQLGGAVKNVLAIAVGMADGLGFGTNTKTALMTRGLAEMTRLGVALGAQRETFTGLACMGDLILTCSDNQSRNRRFGCAIGKGDAPDAAEKAIGQVVEGKRNAKDVFELAKKHIVEMPIVEMTYRILYENAAIKDAVHGLLARPAVAE